MQVTDKVDFFNILRHHSPDGQSVSEVRGNGGRQLPRLLRRYHEDPLSALMNGPIKKQLNIPQNVVWGGKLTDHRVSRSFAAITICCNCT